MAFCSLGHIIGIASKTAPDTTYIPLLNRRIDAPYNSCESRSTKYSNSKNPSKKKHRFETHCYGPKSCPKYKAGRPYRVPGRNPGMIYIDDDVERANNG